MRTQQTSPLFHRPDQFDSVVQLWARNAKPYYTLFTNRKTTRNATIKIATEGGYGIAPEVDEDGAHSVQDFSTPYNMERTPRIRGFGTYISRLAQTSDHMGIIGRRAPKQVAAIKRTKEIDMANMALNLASSSANATPDGLSLANAAHLKASGTFTNIITGNPALGYAGLVLARKQIKTMPLHEGEPSNFGTGRLGLLVPPELEDLAMRLTGSDKLPTTADNDPNVAGRGITVISSPYFDASTTAWALVSLDPMENPLQDWERNPLTTWTVPPSAIWGDGYFMNEVWASIAADPRGYVFSTG